MEKSDAIFHKLTSLGATQSQKPAPQPVPEQFNYNLNPTVEHNNSQLKEHKSVPNITPVTIPVNNGQMVNKRVITTKVDPSDANNLEEQLSIISNCLTESITKGNMVSAVVFTNNWIEGILDESHSLRPVIRESLKELNKDQLVNYIEVLLKSLM